MTQAVQSPDTEGHYTIRPYESGDREGFLDLYRDVMGAEKGAGWFAWKYRDNPHVDHVPMLVATRRGEIVGARPFFALPMAIEGNREILLQPADTMVHPEHRRQGLFTRMTERAIERYRDAFRLFFNFPNDQSRPGYLKLGWEVVSTLSSYARVANPGTLAAARTDRTDLTMGARLVTPFAQLYHRLQDERLGGDSDNTVSVHEGVPAARVAALYEQSPPEAIHAVRSESFLDWRFANPDWSYTTYLAEDTAAIVTGTAIKETARVTKLTDVLPLQDADPDVLRSLIERIIATNPDTDVFLAPSQGFPAAVLRDYSFRLDDRPPLSLVTKPRTHVVRTLGDEPGTAALTDETNWLMTFVEEDTS